LVVTPARISPQQAHRLMLEQGYVYLDVRTQAEVEQGHPQGAYNVPLMLRTPAGLRENREFLAAVGAAFAVDAKLVVGCQSGSRSRVAAQKLIAAGYRDVVEQGAGYGGTRDAFGRALEPGWHAAGLPSATELLPGRDYASLARGA
jgi:rhodanese-related sulfurtransferase